MKILLLIIIFLLIQNHLSQLFKYGQHYPYGVKSVDYLYSESGTWKFMGSIQYKWNYYNYTDNPKAHPYNISELIKYADGTHTTTCRDANKHILLDYNHDGQIDVDSAGYAFCEHYGRGVNNTIQGTPFTNFWFDDNSLAIFVSQAYNRQQPEGLSQWNEFERWRIMSGKTNNWVPYKNKNFIDLLVLDGLYYLAINVTSQAKSNFESCLNISNSIYNNQKQRYEYQMSQNYKLGMTAVFASFLFEATNQQFYLDHYISLRSNLISFLQRNDNQIYSWMVFNNSNPGNLYNTETMSLGTLGLSAGALYIYQIGQSPLSFDNNSNFYYDSRSNIFRASVNNSTRGYLVYGVNKTLKAFTNYTIQFILRVESNQTSTLVARTEIIEVEGVSNYTKLIRQFDFANNKWTLFNINFSTKDKLIWDFRLLWEGNISLDCSILRIKENSAISIEKKQNKKNLNNKQNFRKNLVAQ